MRAGRRALIVAPFAAAAVLAFGVLAPPEHCPSPTVDELRRSADAAVQWFVRNQQPDGTWLYEYDAAGDVVSEDYNLVRHAGAVMGLYQAAGADVPGALASADRGMEWARQHLVEHDDWTAMAFEGRAPTGATALLVAGLAERRLTTDDDRDDEMLRSLGRFLVARTGRDGAVVAQYDTTAMEPVAGSRSKYYTGETYWALARLHRLFPDDGFGAAADRVGHYLATARDDVEDHWPPVPDHWAAYGLAETVAFPERRGDEPLTEAELDYARQQAGSFGNQVRWVSQQAGPWGVAVRGTHVPRGGGYGVVGEAMTGLWRVAEADERLAGERRPIGDRATCIAGLAIAAQDDGHGAARPELVAGAWFDEGVTRMDDQQHAVSALLRTVAIVDVDDGSGHDVPSGWLWAVALVAVLNPLRVAMAVPRRATGGDRAALAAAGAAVGAVTAVVAAALSGPVLDVLHVSEASARFAVAVVGAVAALAAMVQGAPRPLDAAAGWSAAVVPVAVPLVAGPAVILLALGAGADLGVLFVTGWLALAVAALSALAGLTSSLAEDGAGRAGAAWAQRLVAAIGAAACVLLAVDAVMAV